MRICNVLLNFFVSVYMAAYGTDVTCPSVLRKDRMFSGTNLIFKCISMQNLDRRFGDWYR